MNKGVNKARKSIEQRKKMRQLPSWETSSKQVFPSFPQEEEKHGYFPTFTDNSSLPNQRKSPLKTTFLLKGVLSVMLFLGTAFVLETNSDMFSQPKEWTSNALTEEFPFARVNLWYQETFGTPLAFAPKQQGTDSGQSLALPVSGNVTESFQANGTGIMIAPTEAVDVAALRDGIVIFAGNDRDTDKTVVVQHADGSKSTYGYLNDMDVHVYQFIATGQRLGKFAPTSDNETVYFAIEKNNQYMDPVQVIKVDDHS